MHHTWVLCASRFEAAGQDIPSGDVLLYDEYDGGAIS